jgi:pimeloyl-ACP methyl ester carboxylesterase
MAMNIPTASNRRSRLRLSFTWGLVAVLTVVAGCSYPISARKTTITKSYRSANVSALNGSSYSSETRLVLYRFDLEQKFAENPEEVLRLLHEKARGDQRRDVLYALAELCYAHGKKLNTSRGIKPWVPKPSQDYFLSAAIYSYLYLFGVGEEKPAGPFEPQFRSACDLYNFALAQAFIINGSSNRMLKLELGGRALAVGTVKLEWYPCSQTEELMQNTSFYAADEFKVKGLSVRNEQGGLGATLIGVIDRAKGTTTGRHIPATLILRGPKDVKEWSSGEAVVTLELVSGFQRRTIELAGQQIPIRTDTTTPLAYALNSSWVWEIGKQQFFSYHQIVKSDVYQMQPYEAGRIPVVLIHGTFSTPTWWAEMANSLQADPLIGTRYQLWYYIYNSGKPVLFTAAEFRTALTNTIHRLDPQGQDPALQQMVLIGHSQGGLLAKLAVADVQDKLWKAVTDADFDTVELTPEDRATLQRNFFFSSVPAVKRVVFLATPHRGSYQITAFLQNILTTFISLPFDIIRASSDLSKVFEGSKLPPELRGVPNSVAGMSPKNPVLQVFAEMPPAPGVKVHSIIAVKGDGDPKLGSDGVVKYTSAHLDYAESELIVPSGHSVQVKPAAIEEVRRILLEHLKSLPQGTNALKL